MDIDAWLGDYAEELDKLDLASWHVFSRRELVGANWKVCYDGYLEGYHFASLHRNTIFKQTMSNLMATDAPGPHQRIVFARHSLPELRELPEDEWVPTDHIGPVYTIFPHVSIAGCWGEQAMVSQLFPGPTADRSRTVQTIITRHPIESDEAPEGRDLHQLPVRRRPGRGLQDRARHPEGPHLGCEHRTSRSVATS